VEEQHRKRLVRVTKTTLHRLMAMVAQVESMVIHTIMLIVDIQMLFMTALLAKLVLLSSLILERSKIKCLN
jgi:hypothetical protein